MTESDQAEKSSAGTAAPGQFGQLLSDNGIESNRLPDSCGVETIEVDRQQLENAVQRLRKSPEAVLDLLLAVSGVDSPESYDSVYHLWSTSKSGELVIKVRVAKSEVAPGELPEVPSLARIWSAANWHERESYDLVGIRYSGHPYLRRILNPWNWVGHPLRRDYKQPVDALNDKNPVSFR